MCFGLKPSAGHAAWWTREARGKRAALILKACDIEEFEVLRPAIAAQTAVLDDIGIKAERVPLRGASRYQGNGADGEGFATLDRWARRWPTPCS